jgi:hypothetical protein
MTIRIQSLRYAAFGAVLMLGAGTLAGCGGSSKTKVADSVAVVESSVVSADSVVGTDGAGADGAGSSGADGADEVNGSNGADGVDGVVGANGADGSSVDSGDEIGSDSGAASSVAGATGSKVPLLLTGNGVDGSKFGDKFETVMTAMTAAHGAFDDDSLWEEQQAPCEGLGTKERRVQWGSVVLVFSNGPTKFGAAGVEHFISVYSEDAASPTPSNAPDGKGLLDETVGGLKKRFPGVDVYNNEISGPSFQIKTADGGEIGGILSGLTDKDSVVSFNEGLICMD